MPERFKNLNKKNITHWAFGSQNQIDKQKAYRNFYFKLSGNKSMQIKDDIIVETWEETELFFLFNNRKKIK